ncbi:hypothetical protein DERF_008884 [Dermatophagoides farinae]|uniref:Uncharacterized protein n=1 Tax=Dermatophagoides farinae TaxID=6954 RepID=A0A922L7E5_DERFA|nr:hypothetical protein DERF_008884 [Dermatophagoides farinae]
MEKEKQESINNNNKKKYSGIPDGQIVCLPVHGNQIDLAIVARTIMSYRPKQRPSVSSRQGGGVGGLLLEYYDLFVFNVYEIEREKKLSSNFVHTHLFVNFLMFIRPFGPCQDTWKNVLTLINVCVSAFDSYK